MTPTGTKPVIHPDISGSCPHLRKPYILSKTVCSRIGLLRGVIHGPRFNTRRTCLMEASKEGEMPNEPAPETLPTEIKEEGPKKTKLLAVIVVVIVIIAAIAAAFGLGLFGGKDEETNLAPTAGARALTSTTIPIGGTVKFESLATDPDGTIAKYWWYFGDGTSVSGDAAAAKNVTHTYAYGGHYWVYHIATDDGGLNGSNEAAMVGIDVLLYIMPPDPTNTTAPFAFLTSNVDVIDPNTTVNFNMTSSARVDYSVAEAAGVECF